MTTNLISRSQQVQGVMADSITVSRIRRDEQGRSTWTATVTGTDLVTDKPVTYEVAFRSNRTGEGMWIGGQQILGTSQLDATRRSQVVVATLRHFGVEQGEHF